MQLRTLFILMCVFGYLASSAEDKKPHVVFVVGTLHYSPQLTMPVFAKELERFGFKTTVLMGDGNPEKKKKDVVPGIDKLKDADLVVFFTRFMIMPDDELKHIVDYLKSGKPVIGLRTANHAFKYPKTDPKSEWNDGFGRRALGTPYIVHQSGSTDISIIPKYAKHPIMSNITKKNWVSPGTLYLTRLQPGSIPLVQGIGKGKSRLIERGPGPVITNESETDVVAWAWKNEWGGKVFGTSFGHPGDFAEESFNRMLVNAACWCVDKELPKAEDKINTFKIERADKKKKKK